MSKYINVGSYGCVIKPNLNCDGTFGNENQITKFFFNEDNYKDEKKNHKQIEKIDKKKKFTIKIINSCKITLTPEIKKKIKNLKLCKLEKDEIYQIIYENGGDDIYNMFKINIEKLNKINLFSFLQKFVNIFEGLCIINENNLVHFDIRLDNILFDFKNNKFNIIDFGLMNKKKNVYTYNNIKNYNNIHPNYPNDINIVYNIYNEKIYEDLNKYELNSNILVKFIYNDLKNLNTKYKNIKDPYFKKLLKNIIEIYNYFSIDIFKQYNYIFFKKLKISKIIKDFGDKVDVYLLGIALFNLLLEIFKKLNNNSIKKIPLELFSLIKKMILFNPYDRLTIQQATSEFKIIMKII